MSGNSEFGEEYDKQGNGAAPADAGAAPVSAPPAAMVAADLALAGQGDLIDDMPATPVDEDSVAATALETPVGQIDFEGDDDVLEPTPVKGTQQVQGESLLTGDHLPAQAGMEDDEEEAQPDPRVKHQLQEEIFRHVPTLDPDFAMSMPTMSPQDIVGLVGIAERMSKQLSPEQREAVVVHGTSMGLTLQDRVFQAFFEDPTRKLTQVFKSPGGITLAQSTPSFDNPKKGALLDAATSSAYAARLLNAFDYIYLMAHHSGMWLKVAVPARRDLHNLLSRVSTKRGELGYATRGATFSCDTALRNMEVMNFIIERTTLTNMVDSSQEAIRRNLAVLDIPVLAQQLASTIHPSGYPVERACSTSPGVCAHIERDVLRISKMLHVDTSRFSESQTTHLQTLLKRGHRKTEQDMQKYRAEFGATNSLQRKEIYPGFVVTFQYPMLDVYEDTSEEWASGIRRASESVLNLMTEEEGRRHTEEQANLAVMTKYSAWVSEITMNGSVAADSFAIRAVLTQLSDKEDAVREFTKGVTDYITNCTVAAVGVDDYLCPKCNGKQATSSSGLLASVAAIDAVSAFFTLAQLKIQQALSSDSVI